MNACITFILVAVLLLTVGPAGRAEEGKPVPDSAAMATEMMAMVAPAEEHVLLEKLAGAWHMDVKAWMQPGSEPTVLTGTGDNEMILGGRFLACNSVSGEGDMYTESLNIFGFDRRYEQYTVVGFDTWGTYYVTAMGPIDEATGTITMSGESYDPIFDMTQVYDMVLRIIDENHYVFEIIFRDEITSRGTGEYKMVEVSYTRKE